MFQRATRPEPSRGNGTKISILEEAQDKIPKLCTIQKSTARRIIGWRHPYGREEYQVCASALVSVDLTAADIEEFCSMHLPKSENILQAGKLGLFISAMINKVIKEDDTITIDLRKCDPLTMKFIGNLGIFFGKGKLIIKVEGESCGQDVGAFMKGGEIVVEGNVGSWVGAEMMGGHITVKGNADAGVGIYSKGGRIDIEGKVNSSGTGIRCNAEVYCKGSPVPRTRGRGLLK